MNLLRKIKNKIKIVVFKKNRSPFALISNNQLMVGKMSFHNGNFSFRGDQKGVIGSYCAFGKNVTIITSNHDYNYPSIQGTFYKFYFENDHPGVLETPPNKERTKGDIVIGSDVWIADNVTILSGVKIGNGVCIANNSVVTKDVEDYTIVAGIPAKEIKKRYDIEKIEFLMEIKWWDWSYEKIIMNKEFFMTNLNKTSIKDLINMIR